MSIYCSICGREAKPFGQSVDPRWPMGRCSVDKAVPCTDDLGLVIAGIAKRREASRTAAHNRGDHRKLVAACGLCEAMKP